MSFLGLYTKKELQEAKKMAKVFGKKEGIQEANKDFLYDKYEVENKLYKVIEENEVIKEKVEVLKELLVREVDKDNILLEKIEKRTKKKRTKIKCDNRIMHNRIKKLSYERC